MNKQEAITNISTIFNRKSSQDDETIFFENKKHDDLLDIILRYIENSSKLIGNPLVYKTQSLNDHGVDLIIEYPNKCKIGIQIKSHFDVKSDDFAVKVKAQLAESQFHGLDKWYLLICCPLKTKEKEFTSKISHLINELSSYKTSYHIIYNPQQSKNILCSDTMEENEFRNIKNQYYFEEVNWKEILVNLKTKKRESYIINEIVSTEKECKTAKLYANYLDSTKDASDEEIKFYIQNFKNVLNILNKLSLKTREFMSVCLSRGKKQNYSMSNRIIVSCQDIENYLNINTSMLRNETSILDDYNIAYIDDINENNLYYIVFRNLDSGYDVLGDIKEFCEIKNKKLENIIVNLDFSNFDN